MKKLLTNNLGLKALSFLVAFAIWLVVVNIADPVIQTSFSGITVEIINNAALAEKGKTYEVVGNSDVIDVTIIGKRSVVESIGKENIRAVADVEQLSLMNTVEIKLSTNKNFDQLDSIRSNNSSVQLAVEDIKEIHLPISVNVLGTPAEGFVVGDIVTNQNTVRISGPESVISRIDRAESQVSVDGRESDITTYCDIVLLDKNSDIIEESNLSLNIKSVNLSAAILATKAVDIEYAYIGEPAEGYMVSGELTAAKNAMYIAGKSGVIDSISSIVVPENAIDISGAESSYSIDINVMKYLPDGVKLADSDFDGRVTVKVPVEKIQDKTVDIPVSDLLLVNVPAGCSAEIALKSEDVDADADVQIEVVFSGTEDGLKSVSDKIKTSVDIKGYMAEHGITELKSGIYKLPLSFDLPEYTFVKNTYYAEVIISAGE